MIRRSPYQSPQVASQPHVAGEPAHKAERWTCAIGFWISIIHILLMVLLLFSLSTIAFGPDTWDGFPFLVMLSLHLYRNATVVFGLPLPLGMLAAYGFYRGRRGRTHGILLAVYACLALLLLGARLAAAIYLVSRSSIGEVQETYPGGGFTSFSTTWVYTSEEVWETALLQLALSTPLLMVMFYAVLHRLSNKSTSELEF